MSLTTTQALRLAAASQLLVVVGLLVRDHRRSRIAAASSLLAICVVCYLVMPLLLQPGVPAVLRQVAGAGAVAVPFAFWFAARLYFDDDFQPTPVHGLVLLGCLAVRAAVVSSPLAMSALGVAAVVDALRRIHSGGSSDLLLSRLRLRYATLLGTGVYALHVLAAEAAVQRGSRLDSVLSAVNDVGLFLLVGAMSMMLLRVEPDLMRAGAKRPVPAEPATHLEQRLEQLLEGEQIFKTEGLTIGALADRLGEPEYKVRQLINTRLGYRNFGAFLNHYRVREARKLLSDPGQKQLGIAEIAYRHGYASLGPFNRAFKELVGQTPTEYRKTTSAQEILADSEIGQAPSKRR